MTSRINDTGERSAARPWSARRASQFVVRAAPGTLELVVCDSVPPTLMQSPILSARSRSHDALAEGGNKSPAWRVLLWSSRVDFVNSL